MTRLSVVGLGKLGACALACFAYRGFKVLGTDVNKDLVDAINNGKAPFWEPRLQELISAARPRIRVMQNYEGLIRESDVTFLIVPTPSKEDGHFSDGYLRDALGHLASGLKRTNKKFHLFAVHSTVSPGTIQDSLIPLIESVSGKKLNKDFGVCYNPEFIALGSVINDFLNPDVVLIGQSSKRAGDKLEAIYRTVCENNPYIARMSIVSAEIAKISLNSYMTIKISFANALAEICERIPGADVDDITRALGADKRVSPYYLKGGLSYGGPCFPRDNRAFAAFAQKFGIDAKLAKTTDAVNELHNQHLLQHVMGCISGTDHNRVAVLGLAYKANTPVIEESAAVKLIEELLKRHLKVVVYDPLAMENARAYFGSDILYASSVKDCLAKASICVITTQADEFRSIDHSYICHNPTTVIDCWRMLEPSKLGNGVRYISLGRAQNEQYEHHRTGSQLLGPASL